MTDIEPENLSNVAEFMRKRAQKYKTLLIDVDKYKKKNPRPEPKQINVGNLINEAQDIKKKIKEKGLSPTKQLLLNIKKKKLKKLNINIGL